MLRSKANPRWLRALRPGCNASCEGALRALPPGYPRSRSWRGKARRLLGLARFRGRGNMYETEVVLGLMASASALYGFYLAYYTFARSLQFEERVRIYDSSQAGWLGAHESNEGVAQIESRREKLGYFFVGASASFLVS